MQFACSLHPLDPESNILVYKESPCRVHSEWEMSKGRVRHIQLLSASISRRLSYHALERHFQRLNPPSTRAFPFFLTTITSERLWQLTWITRVSIQRFNHL
jgi:hypothetical protein